MEKGSLNAEVVTASTKVKSVTGNRTVHCPCWMSTIAVCVANYGITIFLCTFK